MKAYFNSPPSQQERLPAESDRVQSQFESMHSPLQRIIDQRTIASFEAGKLVCKDQQTGEYYSPNKIFVPSLTYLVPVKDKLENNTFEIKGGWVTYRKAKQLIADEVRIKEKRDRLAHGASQSALKHLFGRIPKPAIEAA